MAHKSKKKHLKHARQHQLEQDQDLAAAARANPPGTKAASAALGAVKSRKMRLTSKAKAAANAAVKARAKVAKPAAVKAEAKAKVGLVRRIAKAATKKLTARPKRIISKAKARVRSVLGRDASAA